MMLLAVLLLAVELQEKESKSPLESHPKVQLVNTVEIGGERACGRPSGWPAKRLVISTVIPPGKGAREGRIFSY